MRELIYGISHPRSLTCRGLELLTMVWGIVTLVLGITDADLHEYQVPAVIATIGHWVLRQELAIYYLQSTLADQERNR